MKVILKKIKISVYDYVFHSTMEVEMGGISAYRWALKVEDCIFIFAVFHGNTYISFYTPSVISPVPPLMDTRFNHV